MLAVLEKALRDPRAREAAVNEFQSLVWESRHPELARKYTMSLPT